jgi:hypothetical protein
MAWKMLNFLMGQRLSFGLKKIFESKEVKMKRYLKLWILFGLAIIGLPFLASAGQLNIVTSDGYNLGLNKPYSGFYVDEAGNVTFMLQGSRTELPPAFQYEPIITISQAAGSTATVNDANGTVSGTVNNPVTFTVEATDSQGVPDLSCLLPEAGALTLNQGSTNRGIFTKTFDTAGTYLVIFKAQWSEYPTQRIIKINIGTTTQPPPTTYTLTVYVNPTGAGTVTPSGGTYAAGTVVNLTAAPAAGTSYTFSSWTGVDSSNGSSASVTMNANKTVYANFSTGGWLIPPGAIPLDTYYPLWGDYIGKDQQRLSQGETKYYTMNLTSPKSSLTLNSWTLSSYAGSLSFKVFNPNGKLIATPQVYGEEISMALFYNYQFCDALGNLQTYNSTSVQPEGLISGVYLVEVKYVSGNPYFRIGWKATEPTTITSCTLPGR